VHGIIKTQSQTRLTLNGEEAGTSNAAMPCVFRIPANHRIRMTMVALSLAEVLACGVVFRPALVGARRWKAE